ncbi:Uma2 family endonuclease [Laspinema palackyanum]|uniref:Uma2 family endonuclease n=1 Tax=Laspinema palackyanum TaxID=3231601 RepID=UPI00345D0BED|nr:Uma2 family endonuclease [Laspinema sp. D2c]
MVTETTTTPKSSIIYPESDGQPMADNTKQFRWIVTIQGGIDSLFEEDPNVFVAGDLLWYPVEGNNKLRVAPDVMVAFGRPKGDRGSYLQWKEDNIPPQVVFEVLSPGNTVIEMIKKLEFYQRYGVEEYYLYDPDKIDFLGWIRTENQLTRIETINGWVSPRLGVRFEMPESGLEIYRPDGRKFSTYLEEAQRAQQAEERAQQEAQRAQQAEERAHRLAEQMRELGIDPDAM